MKSNLNVAMRLIFSGFFIANSVLATAALETSSDHVNASLVSEQAALVPGTSTWLGLRLKHDPHWHTYWINPGDSGLPTKIKWTLPEGYSAADITWPVPKRISVGEIYNFGYEGDALLPVQIEVPANAAPGSTAHIEAEAKWLVCQEQCIPGKANFTIDLPIRAIATADPLQVNAFAAARDNMPRINDSAATARIDNNKVQVTITGTDLGATGADAFVLTSKVVANAPPHIEAHTGSIVLTFVKSDYFTSTPESLDLLVLRPGAKALQVRAAFRAAL
jgi:DsbC/DsbD-like thiol-disulfide interchange protein